MTQKSMIVLIDGAAPEYLTPELAPNLHRIMQETSGFYKVVEGQLPTVTNVNHARLLTGEYPEVNGINSNIFFDKTTGETAYIESPKFLKAPTYFNKFAQAGKTSALLTVKGKIDQIFGADATYRISAETPDEKLLAEIGAEMPPAINDAKAGKWVFETAKNLIAAKSPDFVYATTNDYVMHHFGPETQTAKEFITYIDEQIAAIHELEPDRVIYVTADHGMNAKPTLINVQFPLDAQGFHVSTLLPLADRYLANHQYQESGTVYIYVHEKSEIEAVSDFLKNYDGVERVMTKLEAAQEFHLDPDRIGDLVAVATKDVAFGEQDQEVLTGYTERTHGSLHELAVPLFGILPIGTVDEYETSRDIFKHLVN